MTEGTGFPHIDRPWMKYYEGMYIPDEEPKTNFVEVLKVRNKWRRKKTAYEYYGKRVCYEELWARVDKASRTLSQWGVVKGDIILCLAPNIPEEEEIWFGATQIGAIVDYIDPRPDSLDPVANSRKLLEIIKFERPKYIVTIDKCYPAMIQPIENELKDLGIKDLMLLCLTDSMDDSGKIEYAKDVINYDRLRSHKMPIIDNVSQSLLNTVLSKLEKKSHNETQVLNSLVKNSPLKICWFSELAKECENSSFEIVNDPDLVNYIGHTSGTSGARPKPIPLTNRNAISSIIQCEIAGFGPEEGRSSLHLLPGFAPFGRYTNGIQTYYNKGISIHIPEFLISEFGYLLIKYRPSSVMTPPAFVTGLADSKYLDHENMDYLDKVMVGGDAIRCQDEDRINLWLRNHESNAVIDKGYGMSEYCGGGALARNDYNKHESLGIPMPKTIFAIVDPNSEDRLVPLSFDKDADRVSGEIAVSSDTVTGGILHGQAIASLQNLDGKEYIRTRDIGYMDRDGCFFLSERKGRTFPRVDGYKIKPFEIEKPIETNPLVRYAVIVPYYDEDIRGKMPICHIVPIHECKTVDEEIAVIKSIVYDSIIGNPDMNSRQIPSKFRIRDKIPLNKGNKFDYKALEKEGVTGEEVTVRVNDTNVAIESIFFMKGDRILEY